MDLLLIDHNSQIQKRGQKDKNLKLDKTKNLKTLTILNRILKGKFEMFQVDQKTECEVQYLTGRITPHDTCH